jgi:hypothetical protein
MGLEQKMQVSFLPPVIKSKRQGAQSLLKFNPQHDLKKWI